MNNIKLFVFFFVLGKKLLVLDIDYTLFDHRSEAQTGTELMRPFLHEFLAQAYAVIIIITYH